MGSPPSHFLVSAPKNGETASFEILELWIPAFRCLKTMCVACRSRKLPGLPRNKQTTDDVLTTDWLSDQDASNPVATFVRVEAIRNLVTHPRLIGTCKTGQSVVSPEPNGVLIRPRLANFWFDPFGTYLLAKRKLYNNVLRGADPRPRRFQVLKPAHPSSAQAPQQTLCIPNGPTSRSPTLDCGLTAGHFL